MAQAGPEFVHGYFTKDKKDDLFPLKVVKLGNVSQGMSLVRLLLFVTVLKIMLTHKE